CADRRRGSIPRGLRCVGAAYGVADAADALFLRPHVRAHKRGLTPDVLRDVRLDLPARAILPDGAALLTARVRPANPAVDGGADLRGAGRRRALCPDWRPAVDDSRPDAAGRRARLDRRR